MIQLSFSLLLALLLTNLPAAAAVAVGSNAKAPRTTGASAGAASGLSAAPGAALLAPSAGLTPSLSAPAPMSAAIIRVEAASADAVRSLAADAAPAASFVAAVAARPALLADAGVRAQAVASFGEAAVSRLEAAAAALAVRARSDAALDAALAQLRRDTPVVSPAKAQDALARVAREFGAMAAAADAPRAADAAPAALKPAPRRPGAMRRFAVAALAALALSQAAPVVSMAQERLPAPQAPLVVGADAVRSMLAQAVQTQADYAEFRTADELVSRWNPDTHLYVSGDVGLDRAALRRLSAFLADKHWTVVLVQDGSGFRWTDAQGRTHHGDAAIEYATGQGIYAKGGFTSQVNAATGQRDGSILTVVLQQRVLLLRNSETQKTRGLDGETQFRGNLDQWAVSNMRNGGDLYGAVTETVENVDRLVSQAVAREQASAATALAELRSVIDRYETARAQFASRHPNAPVAAADLAAARRAATEAERLIAQKQTARAAQTATAAVSALSGVVDRMAAYDRSFTAATERLNAARAELDALDRAAAAYRAAHRDASGDLARPGVTAWRETLASAARQQAADPRAAEAAAAAALAEIRSVSAALAAHPSGERLIAEARELHDSLAGRLRAGEAQPQLTAAAQALREAASAHENGSSAWDAQLRAAKTSLAAAESLIDAADAAAKTKLLVFWIVNVLGGLLTLGLLAFLNRRAARAGRKAEDALTEWDGILEKKLEAIYGGSKPGEALNSLEAKIEAYVGPATGEKARGWVGETAAVTAAIRKDSGYAKLLLAKARSVHDAATALVRPKAWTTLGWWRNLVWPSGYALAERMLSTEPVEFKPEDGLLDAAGRKSDWREDLYGEAESYKPFKLPFKELMAQFNASAKAAVDAVTRLEYAVTQSGVVFDGLDGRIAAAAKGAAALAGAADGLFSVPALTQKALPAAGEQVAAARVTAQKDPISGIYGGGAEAGRIVDDAAALVSALSAARVGALASAASSAKALAENQVENAWIGKALEKLSAKADKIAADAATKAVAERVNALAAELTALAEKAAEAAKGASALAALRKTLDAAQSAAADARETIGAALGLPAAKMLTEEGSDPSDFIASSLAHAERVDALLGEGDLAAAKESFGKAEADARAAAAVVAAGLESLKTHAAVEQARRAETERLAGLVPERQRVLASIENDFAPSVLALAAGDATHPSANGTVKDNVDEAEAAVEAATTKREKALRAFTEGKVILAADLLAQVAAHQAVAQHRLDEITQKRARLDAAVASNKTAREALEAKVLEYKRTVAGDRRAMKPTLKTFEEAQKGLATASAQIDAAKGDPFKAAAALAAATAALEKVWVSARNDFDAHAEVERSLQAAYKQLGVAGQLAKQAQGDGTADSPAITAAYRELGALENAYRAAVEAEKAAHGDWNALDREADRVTNEAAHVAASLKGELAAAASATSAVSSAASKVREATNWSGSYGVYIPGSPGASQLDAARAALSRGDYQGAVNSAESARRAAASAIASAEAEVERHREEERRRRQREEEERRRRQQEEEDRRRSSSGSSYGGSSGSGGSSWGGSSSGSGRSGW
ncbi:MAG: hypothetical protein SF051_07475 [Elusimicrobiota bacterium]|nr:hypothetical protein [Elusimicrobiota bacterium]